MNGQNSHSRIKTSVSEWKACGGPLHDWSAFSLTVTDIANEGSTATTERPIGRKNQCSAKDSVF